LNSQNILSKRFDSSYLPGIQEFHILYWNLLIITHGLKPTK